MDTLDLGNLFKTYHRRLVGFLHSMLRCELAAEEVAQDAYLRLSSATTKTQVLHPRAYLFQVAHHLAVDRMEREATERRYRVQDRISEDGMAQAPTPEEVVHTQQRWAILASALNELPRACRHAFVLHKLEGLSHTEVAVRLGVSKSMVEKYLMRALSHCRERLQAHR